jgi:hypothetical protein
MTFVSQSYSPFPRVKEYLSTSLTGWTAVNGTGAASIDGGFKVALLTAQTAAAAYPDASSPRYYRDISSDIAGFEDFTIWVRILSATMGADQNIGIALADTSETVNAGICASTGTTGQLTCTPFASAAYIGAPSGTIVFDGTGWIGISRRGGSYAALGGIGTSSLPPTQFASCIVQMNGSSGQALPARFSIWAQKFGGTDMNGVFDNVRILKYV